MNNCEPLSFGSTNVVPDSTITSNRSVSSGSSLNHLKDEHVSRPAEWDGNSQVVITGSLGETKRAEYFSLPDSNLGPSAQIKVELFASNNASGPDLLNMPAIEVATLIPLGVWKAGVDPYGGTYASAVNPPVFTQFFDIVEFASYRLTIDAPYSTPQDSLGVALRMFLLGERTTLTYNFEYGHKLKKLTAPELIETASGNRVLRRSQRLQKTWTLPLRGINDTDRVKLSVMEETLLGRPFIVSGYPDRATFEKDDYTFLARFGEANEYSPIFEDIHSVDNLVLLGI